MIWNQTLDLESINKVVKNSLVEHLNIVFTDMGDDYLEATMPVDNTTRQPFGILHGGASVALAETIGSLAANAALKNNDGSHMVGVSINANHLKSVYAGTVTGRATPVRIGKRIQVWQIDIRDDKDNLICVSRLTMASVKAS